MKTLRAITLSFILTAALSATAFAANFTVNLILPEKTILIYPVDNKLPNVGDKLSVVRGGKSIATVEVTQSKGAFVIAKIKDQSGEVAEGDTLESGVAPTGDKKTDSKKAETKKADAKKPAAKKPAEKKSAEKKVAEASGTDEKPAATKKTDSKKDAKAEKPAAKAEPEKPKEVVRAPIIRPFGFSGLFNVISAEKQEVHRGSLSLSRADYGGDYNYDTTERIPVKDSKEDYVNLSYGLDEQIELTVARDKMDLPGGYSSVTGVSSYSSTLYGIKYTPRKKYLLKGNTHKKIKYAIGAHTTRVSYSMTTAARSIGITTTNFHNTTYFGAVTMQYQKLKWHFSTYYINRNNSSGDSSSSLTGKKRWGSALGIETPLHGPITFIADTDRFAGDYVYSAGMRYYIHDNAALLLGFMDLGNTNQTLFNGTYSF